MAGIEQKHLAGLTYKTSVQKVVDENGTKKKKHIPTERKLKLDDILSQRDDGDTFHIVTKDGKKYDIPKSPAAQKAGQGSDEEG